MRDMKREYVRLNERVHTEKQREAGDMDPNTRTARLIVSSRLFEYFSDLKNEAAEEALRVRVERALSMEPNPVGQ